MMKKFKVLTTIILLFINLQSSFAQFSAEQQELIEELKAIITDKSSHDTTLADAYVHLSELVGVSDKDSMYVLCVKAQQLAEKALAKKPSKAVTLSLKITLSTALNNIGYYFKEQGDIVQGVEFYKKSINLLEELDFKPGLGSAYNNIGLVHYNQGNIPLALEYFHKSIKIREKIGDKKGLASVYNNIASLYKHQKNIPLAVDFFDKCLAICQEIDDKKGIAYSYNNIGTLHFILDNIPLSLEYYQKSLALREVMGDKRGMAENLHNIAKAYFQMGTTNPSAKDSLNKLAMEFYQKSLKLKEEENDKLGITRTLCSIGELELTNGLDKSAKIKGQEALLIAKELGFIIEIQRAASLLYDVAQKQGNWKEALEMRNLQLQMRDSLMSEETMKASISQQAKYEFEKTQAIKDKEHEKQLDIEQAAKSKQKIISYAIALGLILVAIFLLFVVNRLKVTRLQKNIIEKANIELEEKNKEITDSIQYAKRIQNAILPPTKLVKEYLPESFILYKPKDIVAGDFYWMEHKNGKILFAAADCTGHGVPGAMVSVVCNNGLNRSVREHGLTEPGLILDKTREIVIQEFEKSDEEVKDGMDISLCELDTKTNKLSWSGANNPLWIIRNNEIIEYKADKQPIGKYADSKPFTTHQIQLITNDSIYIFTDGFHDQFGGEKGKKFKTSKLKELIISIQDKPMSEQQVVINNAFETWKGNLEQVDDVCIIGVKI